MAISWAQGLLAGAAGVAEYSEQERQRRQQRIDKTNDLKNQMRSLQAKSRYAGKIKRYEDNRSQLQALEGIEAGGYHEQMSLFKGQGYSTEAASRAAMLVGNGKLTALKRPTALKEPEFLMPSIAEGQARSPIGDWAANFSKSFRAAEQPDIQPTGEAAARPEDQIEGDVDPTSTEFEPGVNPSPEEFGQGEELSLDSADALKPVGAFPDQDPFAKPAEMLITKQESVEGGRGGTRISFTDPVTKETTHTFVPSGITGLKEISPITKTNQDGSQTITERVFNPETDEVYNTNVYATKSSDPEAPITPVKFTTISTYLDKGKDNKPQGQFYADFPETEREQWEEADQGEGFFSIAGNETPEGFENAMAGAMLEAQQQGHRYLKGKHMKPAVLADLKQAWKAQSYLKVLGVEGVVRWIEDGALDKELFYGRNTNRLREAKQVHQRLGITKLSDPEQFDKLLATPTFSF